jgi:hypothetical protein
MYQYILLNIGNIGNIMSRCGPHLAAGAAVRATDHFRPSPNRRPTGETGEAGYSPYILTFMLW